MLPALDPNHTAATNNLGEVLRGLHHLDDAVKHYERAPPRPPGPSNHVQQPRHRPHDARPCRAGDRRTSAAALNFNPITQWRPATCCTRCITACFQPRHHSLPSTCAVCRLESRLTCHACIPPRDPHRPLRIGYVSSDFRMHAVEHFIELILASRPRTFPDHRLFHQPAFRRYDPPPAWLLRPLA